MKPNYEAQIFRKGGSWFHNVTISIGDNTYTSPDAMLDAGTEDEALEESRQKVMALRSALEGPKQ